MATDALLTKDFHKTYTPVPARTKTPILFILHNLVISSQSMRHRPPPCHAYKLHWKKVKILLRIDSHRRPIDQSLSHHIYTSTSTFKLFILHYLVISGQPFKHRPPLCHAYNKYWKIVKVLENIDGHRRVIDQSLSHHIYTITSTYQNSQPLFTTLLSYL